MKHRDTLRTMSEYLNSLEFQIYAPMRCVSERKTNPDQIRIGRTYLLDRLSVWTDSDGDTYGEFYNMGHVYVGQLKLSHFVSYISQQFQEVECVSIRETYPEQIQIGQRYLMDKNDKYTDEDGDTYVAIYTMSGDNVGRLNISHFVDKN